MQPGRTQLQPNNRHTNNSKNHDSGRIHPIPVRSEHAGVGLPTADAGQPHPGLGLQGFRGQRAQSLGFQGALIPRAQLTGGAGASAWKRPCV